MADEKKVFDATFVLSYEAWNLEDADDRLDTLLDLLYEQGYEPNGVATIEEATIAID